jgi:UDP-N-acetylglucosamine transferase subunit ALG13
MRKRVIIAPLNWGLGHATRCVPIIQALQARGHTIFIASDGDALTVLQHEFPDVASFELPSYNVRYSRNLPVWLKTALRIPFFVKAIQREQRAIGKIVQQNSIDVIISDNRYGCRSKNVCSIFISHQLNLPAPSGLGWMKDVLNFFQNKLIKKFNAVWIPDTKDRLLSGTLSETNLPVEFIGIQSRFMHNTTPSTVYQFAVVLSGPEPQRTLLEKNLLPQVIALNVPSIFVRGTLQEKMGEHDVDQVKILNYVQSEELEKIVKQSELIVARSGYSTIMDLAMLGKKAIFIPTPGQPEQEYLADKFMEANIVFSMEQEKIDLADALEYSTEYTGFKAVSSDGLLIAACIKIGL